ncbi:guanylate cyclase, partial [Elysia marginata]
MVLNLHSPSHELLLEFALDLLGHSNVTLDEQFKFSLCTDIVDGLCYLHDSPVRFHGRLSSRVCLIDNRFTVKLADYGLPTLYHSITEDENKCLWKAPELLRGKTAEEGEGREADIYSCAIVMEEVFSREAPYFAESDLLTVDEILDRVAAGLSPPFRPSTKIWSDEMKGLIEQCWAEEPKQRPTAAGVKNSLRRIT